jgi:hypothetical protein
MTGAGTAGAHMGRFGAATLMIVCLAVGLLMDSSAVLAAVRQASSCNKVDVEAAVNSSADGDTVLIPAGRCTWTKTLSIQKILTIQGAGIDQTVLVHGVNWADGDVAPYLTQVFALNTKPGGVTRLTGMTIDGGTGTDDPKKKGMVTVSGSSTTWRVDHVRFIASRTWALVFNTSGYGVIDHNVIELAKWGLVGITGWHSGWGGKSFGDGSWAAPSDLGSGRAVYVEDNLFRAPTLVVAHGGYGGERIVWRYNRMENVIFANHGTESTGRWRGGRTFEVYNNTFVMSVSSHIVVGMRSGVGVVFNNTVTGSGSVQNVASLHNFRSDSAYSPWGKCNGTSAWDGNQGTPTGYPCLDQPGRGQSDLISGTTPTPVDWPNQRLEPSYAWNNTLKGSPGRMVSETSHIVEGRDFFNSPMPGYTPYVYPHPLVTGASPPTTTTAAPPTNLQVR